MQDGRYRRVTQRPCFEQAQKLQKRELDQQKNGVDGEDHMVHMGSARAANSERRKRRKHGHGDVEMADAEVQQQLALAMCYRSFTHFCNTNLSATITKACASNIHRCGFHVANNVLALQGDIEEQQPEMSVPKLVIPDLRQILKRQDEPRATGLFSAAEFIALDDDEAEPHDTHESVHEGGTVNGMDTDKALTGTVDSQPLLTTDMAANGDLN